jgi:hypothetical protein
MNVNCIPVFYHIPKNSGTYVLHCILSEIKTHTKESSKVITVLQDKRELTKLIALDSSGFLEKSNICMPLDQAKTNWNVNVDDLEEKFLQNLSIYAVIVKSRGFKVTDTLLNPIFNSLSKFNLHKFIILREPFSRQQSLYHYLTSDKSKHEPSHGNFKSSSFEKHIMSNDLRDGWLIRNLLGISWDLKLTEDNFNKACDILQSFNVYDIEEAETAIKEVLLTCFNIQNFDTGLFKKRIHENTYKKIKLEDFSLTVQKTFIERTYWDQKLYNYFITKK